MFSKATQKNETKLSERQQRIFEFLDSNRAGVLATVDPNGEPHATVVYHTIDREFNVAFLTKKGTKKYDNLIRNNHVMYVVFEPDSQTVAQVTGEAQEIKDSHGLNKVAAAVFMTSIKTSDGGMPPISKLQAGEYAAFNIAPKQIRMAAYAQASAGEHDQMFESIESFELRDN